MNPTPEQIEAIEKERGRAMRLLEEAMRIFARTGCSLGADTVRRCIEDLHTSGCDEY